MPDFPELIQGWQVFYATLAAVCATLAGLLFIAFTLNADFLNRKDNAELLRQSRKAFGDFLLVLMTSLVFLVPRLPPVGLAVALLSLGLAWSFSLVRQFWSSMAGHSSPRVRLVHLLRIYGLSIVGGLGLVICSIAVFLQFTHVLYWLVIVWASLLSSASMTAWSILTRRKG